MASMNSDVPLPLSGVAAALRRAGQRARELAKQTHTPLVMYRDGRVEFRFVLDDLDSPTDRNAFEAMLDKVPHRPPLPGDE